jgi:hypothetical protein
MMSTLPETTLSSPLIDLDYDILLNYLSPGYVRQHPRYKNKEATEAASSFSTVFPDQQLPGLQRHTPALTPKLWTLGRNTISASVVQERLSETEGDVTRFWEALREGMRDLFCQTSSGSFFNGVGPAALNQRNRDLLADVLYWLIILEDSVRASKTGPCTWIKNDWAYCNKRFVILQTETSWIALTHHVVLMLKDLCFSKWIVDLLAQTTSDKTSLSSLLSLYEDWARSALEKYDNLAYDLLKGIEALSKTRIIEMTERVLDGKDIFNKMWSKYQDKERTITNSTTPVVDHLVSMLRSMRSPSQVSEFFGFCKLAGHPYADPIGGCISSKTLGQASLPISPSAARQLEWSFCHLYVKGYVKEKGVWPPLEFNIPGMMRCRLKELHDKNHPSLPMGLHLYPPSDWEYATFAPHIKFDMGEDILSLIDDKAISYRRDEFDAAWHDALPYNPPKPSTSNRALTELLSRPTFDLSEVIDKVSRREVPEAWKIVTVSPKEREMKREPRMFAMMVLELRYFFANTEHNIADGIFRYIPEQTMTLSRKELIEKFLSVSRYSAGGWRRAYVEIDFSRWNLMWRDEVMAPIGLRLNQIYGVIGIFDYVHEFFSQALINLRLYGLPPDNLTSTNREDPPESDTLWYNHKGGFEGITQKLWTAATLAMVHTALWPLGILYHIVGQADNQVLVVDYYPPKDMSEDQKNKYARHIVAQVKNALEVSCLRVGQEVKAEECIESTTLLTYGKEMWLKGAYLPASAKYLSRIFPSATADDPSLHGYLGNISSGGVAAVERSLTSLPELLVTEYVMSFTLRRELRYSLIHGVDIADKVSQLGLTDGSNDLVFSLLTTPSNLGGLPIPTIPEFLYRGHTDPLASSIAHLYLLRTDPVCNRYLSLLEKDWLYQPTPEYAGLILDPFAAPLATRPTASLAVAGAVRDNLIDMTTNTSLLGMLVGSDKGRREQLFADLVRFKPIYPKILHDIYKASPAGVSDTFSKRFTNSRTILGSARRANINILTVSSQADRRWIESVLFRVHLIWKVASLPITRLSLMTLSSRMRDRWNLGRLEGVSNVSPILLGVYHGIPCDCPIVFCDQSAELSMVSSIAMSTSPVVAKRTRGAVQPYLGSETKVKSVYSWTKPVDSSPPLRDVLKLLSIAEMITVPGSSAHKYLLRLAQSKTTLDLTLLQKLVEHKVGGTHGHRYTSLDESSGTFLNIAINWASHLTISSNLARSLGTVDRPVSFQEIFLTEGALVTWLFNDLSILPPYGVVLVVDVDNLEEVGDQIVDSDVECPPFELSTNQSYYSCASEVKLSARAIDTAVLSSFQIPGHEVRSTVEDALAELCLAELTRAGELVSRGQVVSAQFSSRTIVDLPEVKYLLAGELLTGAARSLLAYVSSRALIGSADTDTRVGNRNQLLHSAARRLLPRLFGTVIAIEGGVWNVGASNNNRSSLIALWRYMTVRRCLELVEADPVLLVVYSRGSTSVSRTLLANLLTWMMIQANRTQLSYLAVKRVARLARAISQIPDEMIRVHHLVSIYTALELDGKIARDNTSAIEVMRSLRSTRGELKPYREIDYITLPLTTYPVTLCCSIIGSPRFWEDVHHPFSEEMLFRSWCMRPYSLLGSSPHRWAYIANFLRPYSHVLVLGIGEGDILKCIPPTCTVTAVDTSVWLEQFGQSSVSHKPGRPLAGYTLHPVSWMRGGDITRPSVLSVLESECRAGMYTSVIIDVEGVAVHRRLEIREKLALTGVPTYVRVLFQSRKDKLLTVCSFLASHSPSLTLWEPEVGLGLEIIIGGLSMPQGLATPACVCHHRIPILPAGQIIPSEQLIVTNVLHASDILFGDTPVLVTKDSTRAWVETRRLRAGGEIHSTHPLLAGVDRLKDSVLFASASRKQRRCLLCLTFYIQS